MILKTKKFKLPVSVYIHQGFFNLMRTQWWVWLPLSLLVGVAFYGEYIKTGIALFTLLVLYMGFWLLQLYGVTLIEENRLMFEAMSYQISSKQIMMQITTKRGMPIMWDQIQYVRTGKKSFTLFMGTAQFLYLPYKIFGNPQDIAFLKMLLRRKKLLK